MIQDFKLKFGRVPGAATESVRATPITVFVGPNNSGKSKVLREIDSHCRSGERSETNVILDRLTFASRSAEDATRLLRNITLMPEAGENVQPGMTLIGKRGNRQHVPSHLITSVLTNPSQFPSQYSNWFLNHLTLMLDGTNRMASVHEQQAGDLLKPPMSNLQALFADDSKRFEVRRILHEAFEDYFMVDPTRLGNLRIAFADELPSDLVVERGTHQASVDFYKNTTSVALKSDGVKAFTGMICEIVAGDPQVILIDEPEAFLHPSLSFHLGKEISAAAAKTEKRLFVSTHSPTFVMGCIQSGVPVNIVRLTYRRRIPTARVLENSEILKLMRNPLLRSIGVIGALFYEFVIVTESDTDRAFYQEINERLLRVGSRKGIPNCLFLNAQNKQTVRTILKPLRQLGIAVAGIVDIDVLKDGGTDWTALLDSVNIPVLEHPALCVMRDALKKKLDGTGKNMKRDGGFDVLQPSDREAASNFVKMLSDYGLFVVAGGELESWLKPLKVQGHGPSWLIQIFEKMGEDPQAEGYIRPDNGDVWEFIERVQTWLTEPTRKGIPN